MNCQFCQSELILRSKVPGQGIETSCSLCKYDFCFGENKELEAYGFIIDYKEKGYYFLFEVEDQQFSIIEEQSENIVVQFSYLPDITPTNVLSKLPTLLTFS